MSSIWQLLCWAEAVPTEILLFSQKFYQILFVSLQSTPKTLPSLEISNAAVWLPFTGWQTQTLHNNCDTACTQAKCLKNPSLLPPKKIWCKWDNLYQADKSQAIIWLAILSGISFWYKKVSQWFRAWHSILVSEAKLHTVLLERITKKSIT